MINVYAAEATETAAQASSGLSVNQVITIFGVSLSLLLIAAIAWFILEVIADWKIFTKAGEPGWKSIIPIYNTFIEYDICWSGIYGLVFLVASAVTGFLQTGSDAPQWQLILGLILSVAALIMHLIQSIKLSKAFGKGVFFGLVLFILGPIGRIILGFGSAEYVGRP